MSFIVAVRVFLGIFFLASSVVVLTNLYALIRARRLEVSGERVDGVCVAHYWPSGGYVGVIVEFSTPAGDRISVKSSKYQIAPAEVDSPVTVFLDAKKPGRSLIGFEAEKRVGYDTLIVSLTGFIALVAASLLVASL